MLVGHDHDVSAGIGKGVDDDEIMLAAVDNSGAFVVFWKPVTEDAAVILMSGGDEGVTPRCPEIVHGRKGNRGKG